jgi:hypothetical protein
MDYEQWLTQNPGRPFTEYYAQMVTAQLATAESHATLGTTLHDDSMAKAAEQFKRVLAISSLQPSDVCVDYGCGSLRLGRFFIEYLQPDCYWGLDITDAFFRQGMLVLDAELVESKRPRLAVISHESLAQAAAARPRLVVSNAVLSHVHPDELDTYFGNIASLMHDGSIAIVISKITREPMQQTSKRSWVHNLDVLTATMKNHGLAIDPATRMTDKWHEKRERNVLRAHLVLRRTAVA